MAQLTAQGRVKLVFNVGEGMASSGLEQKDHPFNNNNNNKMIQLTTKFQPHKRRLMRSLDSSTRIYCSSSPSSSSSSSSSMKNKVKRLNAEARLFVGDDETVYGGRDVGLAANDGGQVEFERDELACFRGLVLDISYRPVNVVCWKRAICLEYMDKVDVLEYYDQTVRSSSGSFYIPAVLRVPHLLQVVKRRRIKNNLSRKNILCRDNFTCQYCSSRENLTIDHVLPIARGGEWKWENLVTACERCNSKKGQKTVEEANMKLIKSPKFPKDYDILAIPLTSAAIKMLKMRKGTPEEWRQYLSKPPSQP